jgi:transcription elongation GreA/GreB family factor
MQINPIGHKTMNRNYSEHRVIPPVADAPAETAATHVAGEISIATLRADLDAASNDSEEDYRLVTGDRVVIRHLDAEPSRRKLFTMSDIADDPMSGYLLLSSPLGQALSRGSPGDELSFQAGDRERSVLFVSLETAFSSGGLMALDDQLSGLLTTLMESLVGAATDKERHKMEAVGN